MKSTNVYWHVGEITKTDRQKLSGHRSFCLWFTGLSASANTLTQESSAFVNPKKGLPPVITIQPAHIPINKER